MAYILVIIDMQPEFKASHDCLESCLRTIKTAIYDKAHIIVAEYRHMTVGRTHKRICEALLGYDRVQYCQPVDGVDKSSEVLACMENIADATDPYGNGIRICGVNLTYCVGETALSLRAILGSDYPIIILMYASSCCTARGNIMDHLKYDYMIDVLRGQRIALIARRGEIWA